VEFKKLVIHLIRKLRLKKRNEKGKREENLLLLSEKQGNIKLNRHLTLIATNIASESAKFMHG
jgi:hypothetical protein